MQLGSILDGDGDEPTVGRPVEFRILKTTAKGKRRYRVKAVLYPVSEAERQQSQREALNYLRTAPGSPYRQKEDQPLPEIPDMVLREERSYRFLAAALYTAEDSRVKLVGAEDYEAFRQGVVLEQVQWLNGEYDDMIANEYPELITKEQREQLVRQAAGK